MLKKSSGRRSAPCAECLRIKAAYYAASRTGDRALALSWITAMGRHFRAVH
ncbi:hypothetical protein AB0K09_19785 [Streptomyces sp. NPDC049577]|uniref:hypothetical protein n=1 Tax=Streptomyces sp. NPDC049577 TaxID=3155153 RepID=UPI0034319733